MNQQISKSGEYTVVHLGSRIDTTNAAEFEAQVTGLLDGGVSKLILDCAGLSYISSSGLRVFLVVQKRMTQLGGQFRLYGLQPAIREIFDISGFTTILSVFPDLASALNG